MSRCVAFLSRYPPLEGGIAAKTYWLARGLATAGYEVHVITNEIEAGREYRIPDEGSPCPDIPNMQVHRLRAEIPWHLPEYDEQALALLDLTVQVVKSHNVQVLDTGYLVPYGIIGHLAKLSTGVRHVIRHGGSDVEKFLKRGILGTILDEAVAGADMVITGDLDRCQFEGRTSSIVCQPPYVPDEALFAPTGGGEPRWRLAVIGKVNYHWQHKGLDLVAKILMHLVGQFECLFVGQGKGLCDFRQSLSADAVSALVWRPFVPPWEMPNLLRQLDAVFIFESALQHPVFSNLALEAMSSGVGIITDRSDFADTYRPILVPDDDMILVVPPSPSSAAQMIEEWVRHRSRTIQPARRLFTHKAYVSANAAIYDDLLT